MDTRPEGRLVDVDPYLARLAYDGPLDVSIATLAALQTAHMIAVPFENLHVHARISVRTGIDWSVPVRCHRLGAPVLQ